MYKTTFAFEQIQYETLLKEIGRFKEVAYQVFGIYCQIYCLPHDKNDLTITEFDEDSVTFEGYYRGDTDWCYMPTKYLWAKDPRAAIQADYDEKTKKNQEKAEADKQKREAEREESERNLLNQLIQKYGVPE